jgi:hypothetical protein
MRFARRALRSRWILDGRVVAHALDVSRTETVAASALDLGFALLPREAPVAIRIWGERAPRPVAEICQEIDSLGLLGGYPRIGRLAHLARRARAARAPRLDLAAELFGLARSLEGPGGPAEFRLALVEVLRGDGALAERRLEGLARDARLSAWRLDAERVLTAFRRAQVKRARVNSLTDRARKPPTPSAARPWRPLGSWGPTGAIGAGREPVDFWLPG